MCRNERKPSTYKYDIKTSKYKKFSPVARSVVSYSLRPHGPLHARLACPSPTPGAYPNSCPSSQWCHPAISSSVVPFSSCLQSSSASGSSPKRDEDKCKILEMHLKLKDQQLKTILFICRRLFQNIVGTTNWKSTIDIHTQRKRNPNTTLNLVIEPQENKRKGEDKNPYKDKFKTIKKWQ